jgi:hypothetical protein
MARYCVYAAYYREDAASGQNGRRWTHKDCIDSRPDLCALLRYDSEAYLLLAELDPYERTERVEGRSELCITLAGIATLRCVHITCEGGNVLYLGFEAHRTSWWRGTDASRKCLERLQ